MLKPITFDEIKATRTKYEADRLIQVKVSPYVKVNTTELPPPGIPDISLKFIVGGGWNLSADYTIVGGPDDGKRVNLLHWQPEEALKGMHEKYNGTHEEAEAAYGYTARPSIHYHGTLHIATIMYLRGLMHEGRERKMARHISDLYERFDKQRQAETTA